MNTFLRLIIVLVTCGPVSAKDPMRVICFGDSTTALRAGVVTYCQQLEQPGLTMLNRGVPGNTTEHARARFAKDVIEQRPDVVILQFGINDSSVDVWKSPPESQPRVNLAKYVENLSFFIDQIRMAGAQVILMTFNPLTWTPKMKEMYGKLPYLADDAEGFNAGRAEYAAAVRQLGKDKQVRVLDVGAAFRRAGVRLEELLLDGIHPNTRGQTITTELLRPVFQEMLQR